MLFLIPCSVYSVESYTKRSFDVSYAEVLGMQSGLFGGRYAFTMVFKEKIDVHLEVFSPYGGLLLSFINDRYDGYGIGVFLNLDFFKLSLGQTTKTVDYAITVTGLGYMGAMIFNTDRNFGLTDELLEFYDAFGFILPFGFQLINKDYYFVSFDHRLMLNQKSKPAYSFQISIGKITDFQNMAAKR